MVRLRKPLSELHVTLAGLRKMTSADFQAIDGPKFVTSSSRHGARTLAVLVSHDKWKILNHNIFDADPHALRLNFIDGQRYVTLPIGPDSNNCWQALPETGLQIVTIRWPRKKAKS